VATTALIIPPISMNIMSPRIMLEMRVENSCEALSLGQTEAKVTIQTAALDL
jgi:hypothetical protein